MHVASKLLSEVKHSAAGPCICAHSSPTLHCVLPNVRWHATCFIIIISILLHHQRRSAAASCARVRCAAALLSRPTRVALPILQALNTWQSVVRESAKTLAPVTCVSARAPATRLCHDERPSQSEIPAVTTSSAVCPPLPTESSNPRKPLVSAAV
jgi:hypothetical protein